MIPDADIIEKAIKKSYQSYCRFRVSAIGLDKRGQIVATAVNKPRLSKYGGGSHAEMLVLAKGGNKVKSIVICRTGNSGLIRPIKCCKNCSKVLEKKGIRVYTIGEEHNG